MKRSTIYSGITNHKSNKGTSRFEYGLYWNFQRNQIDHFSVWQGNRMRFNERNWAASNEICNLIENITTSINLSHKVCMVSMTTTMMNNAKTHRDVVIVVAVAAVPCSHRRRSV